MSDLFENEKSPQESVADEMFTGAVLQEAVHEGLITEDGDDLIAIQEGKARKSPNMAPELKKIKVTKAQKLSRLRNKTAILLARKSNDPEFAKYRRLLDQAKKSRDKMYGKYSGKAKSAAAAALRGAGTRTKDSPKPVGRT